MSIRFSFLVVLILVPTVAYADPFDHYFNKLLAKMPEMKSVEKVAKVTPDMMVDNRPLTGIAATFIVVKTNDGRYAKVLIQSAWQKVSDKEKPPIIILERYVTFREGEERTIHASGQNVRLFAGFRFNLDIGQVVPKDVPADLHVGIDKDEVFLEPVGKAEIYLVTKHLSEANPPKTGKLVVGEKFDMRYFNGAYKLFDDGRRSGTLHLKVAENGFVTGHYFSDKDGAKYDLDGKVSNNPKHMIEFTISYPRTSQAFTGYMFTGDGRAITGLSRVDNRETGFYALRIEDEK
ncbi:MAG: hypothetical protein HYR84_05715 [Planctomycetes bacterium]|nr:hypothetical protein [Planctomycetota bacterium]